jgi:hypothetical protein
MRMTTGLTGVVVPFLVACGTSLVAPVVDDRCPAEQSLSFDYQGDASGFFCASGAFPSGTAANPMWSTWAHAEVFTEFGSHLGIYGNLTQGQPTVRYIQMDIQARSGRWSGSHPVTGRGLNWFSIRHPDGNEDIYYLESGSIVLGRSVAEGSGGRVWGTFNAVARTAEFTDRPQQREVRITNGRFQLRVTR